MAAHLMENRMSQDLSMGPPGAQPATAITSACQHAARRWLPLTDTQ